MKYYKKLGDTTAYTTKGKIYPSDYTGGSLNSVYTLADFYPPDWQEVPAGDFYVQKGKMPEYFAIKRVADNPLWEEYIDWIMNTYGEHWNGNGAYYGYEGNPKWKGTNMHYNLSIFENNPIELTLEQWDKIVNKTMGEEFKLPENWYIDVTNDNVDMLNKWYKQKYFTLTNKYLVGMSKWNDGGTKKGHNYKGITKGKTYDFGTKITTEQFIKYVLKEKAMKENDKEIIGWRLKDGCEQYTTAALNIINQSKFYNFAEGYNFSNNSTNASDLKKAGVLELWFEPVLSQKFKVGDWITIEDSNELQPGCKGCKKGTYHVTSKPMTDWCGLSEDDNGFFVKTFNEVWKISNIGARLATPEEIKATQTLKFGGYDVTFDKVTSGVRITCNGETGTFSQIKNIYNTVSKKERMMFGNQEVKQIDYSDDTYWSSTSLKATATSIKIGCTTGDWSEFVAIYEKAKSML